ncbi:MAG TPA: YceD family protein [Friedmanniella sp.]
MSASPRANGAHSGDRHGHPTDGHAASHRTADRRSPLVFDIRALGRRAGAMTTVTTTVPAPADLGTEVIGVPEGSPVELDVRLEAVIEGVLVTGTAQMEAVGECVRCLREITVPVEADIQELFVHDASREAGYEDEDEVSLVQGDLIDLEPVVRDDVVLDLPFRPLCTEDCAGLCPTCGVRLDDDPGHHHDAAIDPRWAALGELGPTAAPAEVEPPVFHPYNRSGPAQGEGSSR